MGALHHCDFALFEGLRLGNPTDGYLGRWGWQMPSEGVTTVVGDLAGRFADARPMRRGSVSERSMKCGQKGCRCQQDGRSRHGPYDSPTHAEGGKTQSGYLSAEQAAIARQQVEAGQEFRKEVDAYWRACERSADAEIDTLAATSATGAAKKGGSKKRLRRKSLPRSKRS